MNDSNEPIKVEQTGNREIPDPNAGEEALAAQEAAYPNTSSPDEIGALKNEIAEWKEKYLRLYADFDNFRKHKMRERIELIQTAGADVISSLLPVLDDFDRAVAACEQSEDPEIIREGFRLIRHKLLHNLEAKGLKAGTALGENFNTDFHEAVTNIPASEETLRGKVVDVLEKGYFLNDKVLRYAKVVVGQ